MNDLASAQLGRRDTNNFASPQLGRREWHRIPTNMSGVLASGEEAVPGRLLDISVGGALFESNRKWVRFPGPCVLRLPLATASGAHTTIRAVVVRASAGRFGLRWTQRIPAPALIKLDLPLGR